MIKMDKNQVRMRKDKTSSYIRLKALIDIFNKKQYKENGISMSEIQDIIRDKYEIEPHRKTLQKDIDILTDFFDYNLEYNKNTKKWEYLEEEILSIQDIEIITNAISSNRFLSIDKTNDLIDRFQMKIGFIFAAPF